MYVMWATFKSCGWWLVIMRQTSLNLLHVVFIYPTQTNKSKVINHKNIKYCLKQNSFKLDVRQIQTTAQTKLCFIGVG